MAALGQPKHVAI